jgi:type II secretory pathway component GspD/PulD (secretin)
MVMMDAVLLRSEDVQSAGRGLNLLDNLSIFLANTVTVNRTFGTAGPSIKSTTVTQSLGLGATPGGGIGYSLNIANASDQRAEVLARPTLLALDRQPAEFFSGSTVSVALVSVQGGGTVEDKPVGVSLSVTPTFIDDDTMLVSVKAVRSFFETTAPSATFEQSVQTSRNMVTANVLLRFGETLILSGLTEREITNTNSRTPALGDVPGLQYLFGRQTRRDYTRSIMVLLTPRRVATFAETLAQADSVSAQGGDHSLMAEARDRARRDVAQTQPNAVAALKHMERNRLFRALRSNDIEVQGWRQPDRVRRFVTDLTELIYF